MGDLSGEVEHAAKGCVLSPSQPVPGPHKRKSPKPEEPASQEITAKPRVEPPIVHSRLARKEAAALDAATPLWGTAQETRAHLCGIYEAQSTKQARAREVAAVPPSLKVKQTMIVNK
ncbi:hypothetical protein NDU88_004695 [Pleurodeles waltl]|uniref:Uncharacterized protein n=1 Tax=Pleurodeles waltl TaxID=8319 RepID=A0AAV7W5Z2_PLEWA|nr:hypothetical protein NDU88_004695 [Pleurodeles waltl]